MPNEPIVKKVVRAEVLKLLVIGKKFSYLCRLVGLSRVGDAKERRNSNGKKLEQRVHSNNNSYKITCMHCLSQSKLFHSKKSFLVSFFH